MVILRSALSWRNAWRIRIVALGSIVLLVSVGSQLLVNTFAAETPVVAIIVAPHVLEASGVVGSGNGNGKHLGPCAVAENHFPPAAIALSKAYGSHVRQCAAEFNDRSPAFRQMHKVLPSNASGSMLWGRRYLPVQVRHF